MENITDTIHILLTKDSFSFLISIIGAIISAIAIVLYIRLTRSRNLSVAKVIHDMEIKLADARYEVASLPKEEQEEALSKLNEFSEIIRQYHERINEDNKSINNKQSGFINQDFVLYAVPAIIAISFTFALIYLLIANQSNVDYKSPEILKSGITTIIGYYFGVAVTDKHKPTSIKDLDPDEFKKQVMNIISKD